MAEDLLEKDEKHEQDESSDEEQDEFLPGELCAVDAVREEDQVDLSEEDESGFTEEEKEAILSDLCNKACQRDLTSYRLEIRDCWKARYFWRGNQYLLPGKNGAWVLPQMILVGGQSYDDHNQETNIYLAFGDTIIAALTAGTPSVRFEPDDPSNPADVQAAESSDGARRLIERANNMIVLQEDIARFLWTDSRCLIYTRYVLDAQRFGYEHLDTDEDELGYLPEKGEKAGEKKAKKNPDEEEIEVDRGEPRGQEVIEAFGAMETKIAIKSKDIEGTDYLIKSEEFDITRLKTKYPKKAKELKPFQTPTANMEYARLARTSIMTGMRPSNMTNDAMTYDGTEQLSWFRPAFYREVEDEKKRNWLYDTFPKGCMVAMVGKTVCEARRESIDDHWTLMHSRPGDGAHRPALGQPIIPLQEKLNDCMDYIHDAFMHLIPIKWVDSEAVDTEALQSIEIKPGLYLKMKRKPDKALAENIFVEPQIQLAEGLLVYVQNLFGEFAQFLCGAFPALFGGNTGANDTASGIASQRDQALGRIGLTWRSIKAGYARIIRQAVSAAATFRNSTMSGELKGAGGKKETLNIDPDDLKGNVRCYPDTDENFPESWVAQRAVWQGLMAAAATNPILQAILSVPQNLVTAKDKIGLPEVIVPAAAAGSKQAAEIMILMQSEPVPNPKVDQAREAFAKNGPPPEGMPPEEALKAQQQVTAAIAAIPPFVSTVPVDEKLDDHPHEMAEIKTWANQPEGIKARAEKPKQFANVRLHYEEHERAQAALVAQQQAAQQQAQAPPKPISEGLSLAFKDLPPEGQVQAAQKFGIKLDLAKLTAEDSLDKLGELHKNVPGSGAGARPPAGVPPPGGAPPAPAPPAPPAG
jgi:hypothetical protein